MGLEIGRRLGASGHEVFGLRRTPDSATELDHAGIKPVIGDVTRPQDWKGLPPNFDWVVNAVSSSKGGPAEYRAVYVEGTRQLLEWLRTKSVRKYVSISSTSVYAQTDGSWVDEKSATEPISETGQVLVEAEKLLLNAAETIPLVILRASGIYGPDRGHLFQQYLRGEAEISGDAQRYLNMIHRDDLAGAVIAALERGRPGEIYNASDDAPVPLQEFFEWLAMTLNRPMPPITAAAVAARKRAITNKRIANSKLKAETSYRFQYPTFREGYISEIKRLGLA